MKRNKCQIEKELLAALFLFFILSSIFSIKQMKGLITWVYEQNLHGLSSKAVNNQHSRIFIHQINVKLIKSLISSWVPKLLSLFLVTVIKRRAMVTFGNFHWAATQLWWLQSYALNYVDSNKYVSICNKQISCCMFSFFCCKLEFIGYSFIRKYFIYLIIYRYRLPILLLAECLCVYHFLYGYFNDSVPS